MESFKPLSDFLSAISNDFRTSATHIAIYAVLLQYKFDRGLNDPIEVFSRDIFPVAKISYCTYNRCIQELSNYGYIKYVPSFKKSRGSRIYFMTPYKVLLEKNKNKF